jgi:DNA polymerase III subunit epsilon
MKNNAKIWWALSIALSILALLGLALVMLFWHQPAYQNSNTLQDGLFRYERYALVACLALIACLGFILARIFWKLIIPMTRLTEEVALIYTANPSHRIQLGGSFGLGQLARKINSAAEKYETLEKSVLSRVQVAKAELEEEKNILATIMAELPDAVLICNKESRIILYNSQAKRFFSEKKKNLHGMSAAKSSGNIESSVSGKVHLGIGRPISDFVEENIIRHALEEISRRLENNEETVSSNFVITDMANRLLKAEASPILNPQREFSGFVVIFNEITQELRNEARAEFMLQSFLQKIRHSVASIKSAIEFIREYLDATSSQQQDLMEIIHSESESLERLIRQEAGETLQQTRSQWPRMPISIRDLLKVLQKKAQENLNVQLGIESGTSDYWVKVDTYAMVLILLFLLERIHVETGVQHYTCQFSQEGNFVFFDFMWLGEPIKIEKLRQWETMQLIFMNENMPLHLKEILDHHNVEIWPHAEQQGEKRACLRMYVPIFRPQEQESIRRAAVLPESRPEFYEFDLFNQPGQSPDLDTHKLKDLAFTVFDTETTGLDPSGGDEIVSIGALRIINGRILSEELFDQLVNPQRAIPVSATHIHGISDDMVRSQPTINEVLPVFYKYTEDTILVAHNAAFDMRMLQMCEKRTGIRFIQPVLDTLLLSAVVHAAQEDQTLSSIASRLGVTVSGRHTAMGDALMTGQIFIKLVELLEHMGIRTLGEARAASEKTYYARLTF